MDAVERAPAGLHPARRHGRDTGGLQVAQVALVEVPAQDGGGVDDTARRPPPPCRPRPGTRPRGGCCPRRRWPPPDRRRTSHTGVAPHRGPGRPPRARRARRGRAAPLRAGRGMAAHEARATRPGGPASAALNCRWGSDRPPGGPGPMSRISGTSSAQRDSARGQRVRKRQPDGGLMGLGGSPTSATDVRAASGSGSTAEASSAAV